MKKHVTRLIDKSTLLLGLDVRYFAGNFTWLSMAQAIMAVFQFLMAIAFANLLTKEIYGEYAFVQSVFYALGFFSLSGMGTAITRAVAQKRYDTVSKAIFLTLVGSVLGAAVLFSFYLFSENRLFFPLLAVSLIFPFFYSSGYYDAFLQGQKRFRLRSIYASITGVLPLIAIIISLILGNRSVAILLVLSLGTTALLQMLFSSFILRKYLTKFELNKLFSTDVVYGIKLSLIDILPTVTMHIDKIFIAFILSATDLAIYSFAIAVPEMIKGYMKNISYLSLPKLSEQKFEDLKKAMKRHILLLFVISLLIVAVYFSVSPLLFKYFFPEYLASVPLTRLYAFSLLLIPTLLFSSAFQAYQFSGKILQMNVLYSGLQIILLFILTKEYGLAGAITARLLSRILTGIYSGFLFFGSGRSE